MANPTRAMVSGRDYQVRYALWRMLDFVLSGGDDKQGVRLKVECDLLDGDGKPFYPDVLLEKADGTVIEIVECKEHESLIASDSLVSFAQLLKQARSCPLVAAHTRFRFVTPACLLRLPDGRAMDMSKAQERRKVVKALALDARLLLSKNVVWDTGHRRKTQLTNECLLHLVRRNGPEGEDLYCRYYALLTAQMARRQRKTADKGWRAGLIDDILLDVYRRKEQSTRKGLLAIRGEEAIDLDLVKVGAPADVVGIAPVDLAPKIRTILRRKLFEEASVSLEDIYVPQKASITIPRKEEPLSDCRSDEEATDLLFFWLTQVQQGRAADAPLLISGSFGSGKSSLLTYFALQLAESDLGIVPLLVPLRDLRAPSTRPVGDVLIEYVKREWQVDLNEPPSERGIRYCLLCDGFDELNLYYLGENADQWVRDCFLELRRIAAKPGLCMAISSRPILFMDVKKRSFEGSDCPLLELRLFDLGQIEQWCAKYRSVSGLPDTFTAEFLDRRGLFPTVSTPLVLYMAARLAESDPALLVEERPYSKAEIYRRFVDWTCAGGYYKDKRKHRLPDRYREMLRDIAWHFFESGKEITESEALLDTLRSKYGTEFQNIPVDRNILVAHMLQPTAGPGADESKPAHDMIEFTHQSFREYLVAEKVWHALEPVRRGEGLSPSLWYSLRAGRYSTAEVELLADMVNELDGKVARHLYEGMGDACKIHAYWSSWLGDMWDTLKNDTSAGMVEQAKGRVSTQLVTACCMATLAFLLRLRARNRLRQILGTMDIEPSDSSLRNSVTLEQIIRAQESVTGGGFTKEMRRVLLQNLEGLYLEPHGQLLNFTFEGIVLCQAILREVYFSGSEFQGADVRDADFSGAVFHRCFLWFTLAEGARFIGADFTEAIFAQERGSELVGGNFDRAIFRNATFKNLAVSGARFTNNIWDGARLLQGPADTEAYLRECTLDHAAQEFFRMHKVSLQDCETITK